MLAEKRWRAAELGWRIRVAPGEACHRHLASGGMLERPSELKVLALGVVEYLCQVEDWASGDFGRLQRPDSLRCAHTCDVRLQPRVQGRPMLDSRGVAREARVLEQVLKAEGGAEAAPVRLVATGDVQPAVQR